MAENQTYTALDIAKWFMWKYSTLDMGEPLTLLKILKLLYYAEGISLAENNNQLFREDIVAWEQGPAVETIFDMFWVAPYNLPMQESDIEGYRETIKIINSNENTKRVLEETFNAFAVYSAWV